VEEAVPKHIILNEEGLVWYQPKVFTAAESDSLYRQLLAGTDWASDKIKIFGREIVTRRKVAWYGDHAFEYRYSGYSRYALPWTETLLEIKARAEQLSGNAFNSCLLNLYHDGSEGMGWHSDDETSLDPQAPIASLSFKENRRFLFRLKSDHRIKKEIILENGSLLLMDAISQHFWQHCLPVAKKCSGPRINLTFRRMKSG
jgi:alkylated DNA repair dioxygenase AlkB